ncbi:MAG: sugar ABC transporter ATP-binding protein [Anaerolinea sp. 4484_236]|nr:MAG: sugar ABC transporter ATP-binding protein [Anaerolinea sp. 4484_236]RLD08702.1 MAG: sugar ABC transporter ATP-binding protein [Chloroflexota bacterium]
MATLTLENVTKKFGKKVIAVNNFSLKVQNKEFLVLLGPSGCGKTTAMRMVAGLEEVTEGRIYISNKDITDLPPRKRNVSMIFQNYAVWPHMTVYDNIAYALKLKRMSKDKIDEIVNDVSKLTKINPLLERYPAQLSGGQQQRVAVARAIAVSPEVFLMDEPLSNLDAKLRVSMRTELKAIHDETNATTVFVTHDQSEAMSMADRIVIMKDGEVIQVGTPDDVYHHSASLFVADFIGTPPTNFLEVSIKSKNGNVRLANSHVDFILDPTTAAPLKRYSKQKLILGIRPENISLVSADKALLSAKCLVSEPQGSHQIIAIQLDDKILKIVAPPEPKFVAGDPVHIAFKHEKLRFFDPETTLAIDN